MTARLLAVAALAAAALAAVPASASAARSFGGETKDEQPIVVTLDGRGRVDRVTLMFGATCKSGRGYSFGQSVTRNRGRVPLKVEHGPGGRFTAKSAAVEQLEEGRFAAIGVEVRGRVRGATVTGTLEAAVVVSKEGTGEPEDECTYRRRSFAAVHAPGRILTGRTSQSLPLVIRLPANARAVRVFHVGWNAGCDPPGFFQLADRLRDFRIRGGAFGDDFDLTIRLDDGTERVFTYKLKGRASRRRASGTISVVMEDKGGNAPGTCSTGPVTWRAS